MTQQNAKRNPYLIDISKYNSGSTAVRRTRPQSSVSQNAVPQRRPQQTLQIVEQGDFRQPSRPIAQPYRRTPQPSRPMPQTYRQTPQPYRQTSPSPRQIARAERERLRRKRRMQRRIAAMAGVIVFGIFLGGIVSLATRLSDAPEVDGSKKPMTEQMGEKTAATVQGIPASTYASHPSWTEDFLTVNEYSRPGDALKEVNSIFVHYTANKGTSAAQNRSYFEQLKDTGERSASSHFIIGYEGEIIQCIPLDEIAYAVQTRNQDSISIECCYLSDDGSFTQETYDSLLKLLKWLTDTYELDTNDILRHYDCGGKKCPVYYVDDESAWERLKKDVGEL